jgi:uncharacterized heparinase superfamily protein
LIRALGVAPADVKAPEIVNYPAFGLYRLENRNFVVLIRYGPVGQRGYGGHAHNDQGSFEMSVNGEVFIVDPGTFVYSADIDARNRFRSTGWQSTLAVEGQEQNDWLPGRAGLFSLQGDRAQGKVEHVSAQRLRGSHRGFGAVHTREFDLSETKIRVRDVCEAQGEKTIHLHLHPAVRVSQEGAFLVLERAQVRTRLGAENGEWQVHDGEYSPGYGQLIPNQRLSLEMLSAETKWWFEVMA